MKKLLLITFLFICVISSLAQKKDAIVNIEIIVSDNSGNVLKDVAVYNSNDKLIGITNHEGITWITCRFDDVVVFSHLSFEPKTIKISEYELYEEEFNNFLMIVKLENKSYILPEVTIVEKAPQLAYKNKEVWVLDYSVDEKGIMAVTTDGHKSYLLHLGFEQDTISLKEIDKELDYLFRDILYQDIFGNTHLMSVDSAFQIYSEKDNLQLLYGVTLEKHKSTFGNITALTDSIIITKKKFYYGQEVAYFFTNRNNNKTEVLCDIYGSSREMAKNWDVDEMRSQRAYTGKGEFANPTDYERPVYRNDYDEDLIKRLMFQEIYAPLLNVDNTIYIFDFQKDYIYKYDEEGRYVDKCEISFHLKSKYARRDALGNPWDKKLIYDKARKECYAQFISDGTVTLKKIDLDNGNIISTYVLDDHYFPENIQVYNGVVYYQFIDTRMTFGKDCRSLYKLTINN